MKIKLAFYLIIGCYLNISAQALDTFLHDDGGMTIWHSEDWNKMEAQMKKSSFTVLNGNYKSYDKNGVIVEEMKFIEYKKNHFQRIKWKDGKKLSETYGNEDNEIFIESIWNPNGELSYQYQRIGNESTTIEYYRESPGNIYSILKMKMVNKKVAQNFKENESLFYWAEIIDSTLTWVPNGEFIKFYRNGNISEKGNFLPSKFKVFKSEIDFLRYKNGEKVTPKYLVRYAKDGEWKYYDENGKLKMTETYEKGNLIKKKN